MHYFPGMTWNDILRKITYKNLLMLMLTIPTVDREEKKEKPQVIDEEESETEELKKFFKIK